MPPLVSVLIPVYNVEAYIEKAVLSIINQTYSNLEIIIVDDCSTDGTHEKLIELSKIDSRIRLFKNKKNEKISKTLNFAFSNSNGEYIVRMDGDDISCLERIEKKIKFLEENKDYDLVGCSTYTIDIHDKIIGEKKFFASTTILNKNIKYITPVLHIWAARRHVYERLKGYREELTGVEDYDFLLRMDSLGLKFTNLENYYGYSVRIGRNGNTNSLMGIQQRKLHEYAYKLYKQRKKNGIDSLSLTDLEKNIYTHYLFEKLYKNSSLHLTKAIAYKHDKKYIKMTMELIMSLQSPHQIIFLQERIIIKLNLLLTK